MSINWGRIGRGMARAISETIKFFGRLVRDVLKDIWKSARPTVIRWLKWGVLALIAFYFITQQPDLAAALLKLAVVGIGFWIIFRGAFPKKKKSRK